MRQFPPRLIDFRETMHRLIPTRYSEPEAELRRVAPGDLLANTKLLDSASDERAQAELHGITGISIHELVFGIPHAPVINGAFTHASASGARFSDATRGAWYAAVDLEVSIHEVAFHKARRLRVIGEEGHPPEHESTYDDWTAQFHQRFHALLPAKSYQEYLLPEPVPECYAASQRLARQLLQSGSNGRSPSERSDSCWQGSR